MKKLIKILIVEDSQVMQEMLREIFSSHPELEVIGTAGDGKEALAFMESHAPDVITMDLHMPRMNGFDATRIIMETKPTPIIIVSASCQVDDIEMSFRSLQAGAVAIAEKPLGLAHPQNESIIENLVQKVKTLSKLKVVRRDFHFPSPLSSKKPLSLKSRSREFSPEAEILAIGASTGGPTVIEKILSSLPGDFSLPILIVQHITPGFTQGFVSWLQKSSSLNLKSPSPNEELQPGHVYIAPDHFHMKISREKRIFLSKEAPLHGGLRPAISILFQSLAENFAKKSIGVLLTGMGKDGALELKKMKDGGATTIVQDEASCVVYGMPKEAVLLGGADYIMSPQEMVDKFILWEKELRKNKWKYS